MRTLIALLALLLLFCPEAFATSDAFPPTTRAPAISDYFPEGPVHTYYCAPGGSNSTGDGSINNPWMDLEGANGTVRAGDLIYLRAGEYKTHRYAHYAMGTNKLNQDGAPDRPIIITNYPNEQAQFNTVLYQSVTTANGAADGTTIIDTNIPAEYQGLSRGSIRILSGEHTDRRKAFNSTAGGVYSLIQDRNNDPFPTMIPAGTSYRVEADTWQLTLNGDYQKLIGTKLHDGRYGIQIHGGMTFTASVGGQISGVEFIQGTSNGGDLNPAMLSVPLTGGSHDLVVSHNYFHDSENTDSQADRMSGVLFFDVYNATVEYNLFENMIELGGGGAIKQKDQYFGTTIRYNKFIHCSLGVRFGGQGLYNRDQ